MSKFNFGVEDGKLKLGVDSNEDGENVVELELSLSEAVAEAFSREGAVSGAKLVDFSFDGGKLSLKLDTDKDGEELLCLKVDLGEVVDEISAAVKKD